MGTLRSILIGSVLGGGGLYITGCTVEADPPPPPVAHVEVAPVGYAYGPEYYDHGYYHDGYWYWHDHDGRYYREVREEHERRDREWHEHEHSEHYDRH